MTATMPGAVIQASFPRSTAIQRRGRGGAIQLPDGFAVRGGAGQPLPAAVRQQMERALGANCSDVRVHVGHEAASIGALAFTRGSDIYFARGQYSPHSAHGQKLLGHELAHVVQQRSGRVRNPIGSGVAIVQDQSLEAEADRMAARVPAAPTGLVRAAALPRTPGVITRRRVVQRFIRLNPTLDTGRLAWRLAYAAKSYNWPKILGNFVEQEQRILEANLQAMME